MGEVPRAFAICVRNSMTYGSETRSLLVDVGLKFERAEMQMIRWMCGSSMKDRRTSEELRRLIGVEPFTSVIKSDEDWVEKCMEFRVEVRIAVGRPRRTWLESVEGDIEELEIVKEDVHNRKKWRMNVMKRKSKSIRKRTITR